MADGKFTTDKARPRKANEYFANLKNFRPPEMLFDEFWREGEVALFFGPARAGKSILAMQVAESIARGQAIDGFALGAKRKKVLYADMKLSENQFIARYLHNGKPYKLSENLYRQKPLKDEKLIDWLRRMASEEGFRVIVIDDISAVKTTCAGTRETLKLMRELKDLRDEFDLSILVIAGSQEQRRGESISEAHLMRSRVLCDAADSVFAIGVHAGDPKFRYLVQTRTQLSDLKWVADDRPVCRIRMSNEGFLSIAFDELFILNNDEDTLNKICEIKRLRDLGKSFQQISDELEISKTTVTRLLKKWTAALESHVTKLYEAKNEDDDDEENWTDQDWEDYVNQGGDYEDAEEESLPQMNADDADKEKYDRGFYPMNVFEIPFMAALKRIPITNLELRYNGYGHKMFVYETYNDGKPTIWFEYDSKGKLIRKDRDSWGIKVSNVEVPWVSSIDFRPSLI